ncbi:hypothetical protein FJ364_00495, partial [Candidatus Dependentiae bacterium]|nr:hypothetical protein [Candidatus Dependentiae bacterium]
SEISEEIDGETGHEDSSRPHSENQSISSFSIDSRSSEISEEEVTIGNEHFSIRSFDTSSALDSGTGQQGYPDISLHFMTRISYMQISDVEKEFDTFAGKSVDGPMLAYNYRLDKDLSSEEVKVFYNDTTNILLITYRGSKTKKDWGVTDPMLSIGKLEYTDRYQDNSKRTIQAVKKYLNTEVWLFGHSLGGTIASQIGALLMEEFNTASRQCYVVTYNKGASLFTGSKINSNEIAYRIKGDFASLSAKSHENMTTLEASEIGESSLKRIHDDREITKRIRFFNINHIQHQSPSPSSQSSKRGSIGDIFEAFKRSYIFD